MKHSYKLECEAGKWYSLFEGGLQFLQGYLDAKKIMSPRLAHRIVRSDGKVIEEVAAREDVSVGMIAGFPTAEQYERAGSKAFDMARAIREQKQREEDSRNRRLNP